MTSLKEDTKISLPFSRCKAIQKLKNLARNPVDLTKGLLTADRLRQFIAESCGYKCLYGTELVNEAVMEALKELSTETQALEKMERLQNGETMNFIHGYPCENRSVLHTATRDFFDSPNGSKAAKDAANYAQEGIEKLKKFLHKLNFDKIFDELIVVGIGGSDLGPKAHYEALKLFLLPNRKIHFISNIDPDNVEETLRAANLSKSLVLINSKSGTTLETATNEAILRQKFAEAGLDPKKHFISATTPGSPLDNKQLYLECFYIQEWIGGRFSSTSLIGGIVLGFAFGFDRFREFLNGANAMDKAALKPILEENLPLLGALIGIWNRNFLNYPHLAIIPYSQTLGRYTAHLQQVDMESNGKRIDQQGSATDFHTGPIIFGEPGTAAQHSFFQLLHQGTTIFPVEFIGFKKSQLEEDVMINNTSSQEKLLANMFAQAIALATGKNNGNPNKVFLGNRPSHILLANQLTPYNLGSLLAYYEHKIAFQGFIWGINSFDQEGVQLGKELANQLIDAMKARNLGDREPSSLKNNAGKAYLDILSQMKDV